MQSDGQDLAKLFELVATMAGWSSSETVHVRHERTIFSASIAICGDHAAPVAATGKTLPETLLNLARAICARHVESIRWHQQREAAAARLLSDFVIPPPVAPGNKAEAAIEAARREQSERGWR